MSFYQAIQSIRPIDSIRSIRFILLLYHKGNGLLPYNKILLFAQIVSVANLSLSLFTPNWRSALYFLLIGKRGDVVPLCVVAFKVCLVLIPKPNLSASTFADIFICLSVGSMYGRT